MPNYPATDSRSLRCANCGDIYCTGCDPKPDGCYCDQGDFTPEDPCDICRRDAHERFLEDTHD